MNIESAAMVMTVLTTKLGWMTKWMGGRTSQECADKGTKLNRNSQR